MYRFVIVILISILMSASAVANTNLEHLFHRYKDSDSRELLSLGRSCLSRQSKDSAMVIFTILANRHDKNADKTDKDQAIEARLALGVINFLNANYAAAYSNFLTATELEGKSDSPGHLDLAAIYLYFGDKKRAYRCLKDVFNASIASGNHYMATNAIINILSSDIDSAFAPRDSLMPILNTFKEKVKASSNNRTWQLATHLVNAKRYNLSNDWISSIAELKKAIPAAKSTLLPERNHVDIFLALGRNFLNAGMCDSAEYYMLHAVETARANHFNELLIGAYADLSDFYTRTGRKDLASEYRYKHLELHDSIFNAKEFGRIHDLELYHETDKFEKRINLMALEKKMRTRMLLIACAVAALLTVFSVILFRQNRNLHRKNKSLFEKNLEIMSMETRQDVKSNSTKKYNASAMSNETRQEIMVKIKEVMADESIFCKDGFSLSDLAELCGSNMKYVSQVLNEDFGKTFNQLLNELRVSVARRRLLDTENYGHLTIEAIVRDIGFKSRSTFSKTFKRITGLSPSEFQHMADTKDSDNTDLNEEQ